VVERLTLPRVQLESGARLAPVEVAYESVGDGPVVFVCHALTGDARATDWWDTLVGPGRAVDTERFRVICANLLGGCQGTTGPASLDAATGEPYGLRFPLFTVRDLVEVHRALLRELGVARVHAAIGGSLGGMQALQWALDHPHELERAILVCASARLKFGRGRRADGPMTMASDFEVEHYLDHQAEIFLARFDPLTYLYLSRVMDYFDPFAEPAGETPSTRFLAVSFDSDWRFSPAHSQHIADELARRGAAVRHAVVASPWGHDSFLMDVPEYHALVTEFVSGPAECAL
jgi:homoserine O-acetyltransferase